MAKSCQIWGNKIKKYILYFKKCNRQLWWLLICNLIDFYYVLKFQISNHVLFSIMILLVTDVLPNHYANTSTAYKKCTFFKSSFPTESIFIAISTSLLFQIQKDQWTVKSLELAKSTKKQSAKSIWNQKEISKRPKNKVQSQFQDAIWGAIGL